MAEHIAEHTVTPDGPRTEQATDWRATGERVEALLAASASGGAVARERGEELVRLVTDFYGAGLERLLGILHDQGRLDDEALAALAADELVAGVLLVHGLHPYGVETRVEQALESVRPYLGSHGGDVELLGVTDEGVVRLRLLGSCDGCPSSSVTLKLAVQGAVEAAAPETASIEVEAATGEERGTPGPLVPAEALFARVRNDATASGEAQESGAASLTGQEGGAAWRSVPELAGLEPGAVCRFTADSTPVLACRIGAELFAFLDRCARCDRPMEGATLARRLGGASGDGVLRCPVCRAHYEVRRAGACVEDDGLHLEPLPLLGDGASVSVAVPAPVTT